MYSVVVCASIGLYSVIISAVVNVVISSEFVKNSVVISVVTWVQKYAKR